MLNKFLGLVNNPITFRLFLLKNLPSAYFSGVRVKYADEEKCVVTVPFKWFTKNPFRSTYFACLSMAAEMSTGVLAMGHTYRSDPTICMLVSKTDCIFIKKATGTITFTSEDGRRMASMIKEAQATGKSTSLNAYSSGVNAEGETVAEFVITWSFKVKTPKG
ncbi:MAG: DUF4442 domain-containing protein [Ferruginibacter sp.]